MAAAMRPLSRFSGHKPRASNGFTFFSIFYWTLLEAGLLSDAESREHANLQYLCGFQKM
jgi:hypothetical protein